MKILFGFGLHDYSRKIIEGSYKVYEEDVTYNWEDGNHRQHHDLLRTRTKGSFTMKLSKWEDYEQLLTDLATVKNGTEYTLTVFAQNTNRQVTGAFFMKIPPELRERNDLTFNPGTFTITIEEA